MRKPRALGRHVEHDPQSKSHAWQVIRPVKIRSIAWPRFAPIFDQGDIGRCTGYALAGCLSTGPLCAPPRRPALRETDGDRLYARATHLDRIPGHYPPDDTGSSGLAVCKAAREFGMIASYRHAFSMHAALAALMFQPVIAGINWYESFDEPDGGELAIAGDVRGGHEVCLSAVDADRKRVRLDNSWGDEYALHGSVWVPYAVLERLLAEEGDVTIPHVP